MLEFLGDPDSEYSNFIVSLLSPAYMNGTSSYQLGVLKEIWVKSGSDSQLFVFKDGKTLSHSLDGEKLNKNGMLKLISF